MLHIDLFPAVLLLLVLFPAIRPPILFMLICLSCPIPPSSSASSSAPLSPLFPLACSSSRRRSCFSFPSGSSCSFHLVLFSPPVLSPFSPFLELFPRLSFLRLLPPIAFLVRSFASSVRRSRSSCPPLCLMVLFLIFFPFFESLGLYSASWEFPCVDVCPSSNI